MARNFDELRAKMSPESRVRSDAIAEQYRASAQVPPQVSELLQKALALCAHDRGLLIDRLVGSLDDEPAAVDTARWLGELDEFGSEPFGEDGLRPKPKK